MAASAGTVTLNLDADSVKLIRELKKAQTQTSRSAKRMRANMTKAFSAMAKGAALFGVAAILATKKSITLADNIAKTSSAAGLSAEQFQEYQFAAERAGVASSQFSSNMTAFVKRVGEAQAGMGPLVSGLKNLNPELLENLKNSKNQAEALRFMADAIQRSDSATERAALANAAFSRSGIGMVNMLDKGAKGLNKTAKEARDLGVVIEESLIRDAEIATDKMGDLHKVLQARIASAVLENADAIVELTESLIGLVNSISEKAGAIGFLKDELKELFGVIADEDLVRQGDKLFTQIQEIGEEIAGISRVRDAPAYASPEAQAALDRQIETLKAQRKILQDIQNYGPDYVNRGAFVGPPDPGQNIINAPQVLQSAEMVRKILADLKADIDGFGLTDDQKAMITLIDSDATDAQINQIRMAQAVLAEMNATQAATTVATEQRNALELEYQSLINQTMTASENHYQQVARLNELWLAGVIPSLSAYDDLLNRLNEDYGEQAEASENLSIQMESFAGGATNAFMAFADGSKSASEAFSDFAKSMLADIARMIVQQMILNAISSFMPGSTTPGVGGFTIPTRDSGGRGSAGSVYAITPKAGTELFIPDSAGTFIPNIEKMGGGGVTVNIDAREADDPAKLLALVPLIQSQIEQSMGLKARRGYA